jgi:hypothetical protein
MPSAFYFISPQMSDPAGAQQALQPAVPEALELVDEPAGRSGLVRDEVGEPVLEGRPEVGLPHEEDREDPRLVKRGDPARRGLGRRLLAGQAAVGVDGDVGRLTALEAPLLARLADVKIRQCLDVAPCASASHARRRPFQPA